MSGDAPDVCGLVASHASQGLVKKWAIKRRPKVKPEGGGRREFHVAAQDLGCLLYEPLPFLPAAFLPLTLFLSCHLENQICRIDMRPLLKSGRHVSRRRRRRRLLLSSAGARVKKVISGKATLETPKSKRYKRNRNYHWMRNERHANRQNNQRRISIPLCP